MSASIITLPVELLPSGKAVVLGHEFTPDKELLAEALKGAPRHGEVELPGILDEGEDDEGEDDEGEDLGECPPSVEKDDTSAEGNAEASSSENSEEEIEGGSSTEDDDVEYNPSPTRTKYVYFHARTKYAWPDIILRRFSTEGEALRFVESFPSQRSLAEWAMGMKIFPNELKCGAWVSQFQ